MDVVPRDIMKNGLYSIHVSLQDGRSGKGSGVIMFRDGKIFGGDAYLFYTGSYTSKGDTFKGEVLVQRHTSSPDVNPLFGGPSPVEYQVTCYSAACSSGATRGRMIWIRVPPPGSESRSSRPPRRLVTIL